MSEFTDYLIELFEQFGPVQARKMFGGYGIYHDGVMFGLVADDTLYLKADKSNVQEFESRGLVPFEYNKQLSASLLISSGKKVNWHLFPVAPFVI